MSGALTHSPSHIVVYLLEDAGLASLPSSGNDWPAFNARGTDTPDNQIVVSGTSPEKKGRIQVSGVTVEHYGIQFKVRATDYETAWAKIEAIKNQVETSVKRKSLTVDASTYLIHAFARRSGPIYLGLEPEETARDLFTANYVVSIVQTS